MTEKVASSGAQSGRFTRWIEENQNLAIALGVGTAVLGGAGAFGRTGRICIRVGVERTW